MLLRAKRFFAMFTLALFGSAFCLSIAGAPQTQASTCTTVQFGAFFKDAAYIIAQQEGFFTQQGLCVVYNQVTFSVNQFNDLEAGKYDIISTAADNVANRIVNQNKPFSLISATDKGADFALAVNTANGINTIADLKGKAIAVDAPNSGFVFALRKILAANGLFLENGDYSFQIVGGTKIRFGALEAGSFTDPTTGATSPVYATMLIYPFTSQITGPVKVAARFSDYLAPYQVNGQAINQTYASKNASAITAYLKAYIQADRFLFNPANHAKVVQDMATGYGVSAAIAETDYAAATNPISGQNVDAKMDKKGLAAVIDVRKEFNGFVNPVDTKKFIKPTKGGFYDDTYLKAALKSLEDDENDNDNDDDNNDGSND